MDYGSIVVAEKDGVVLVTLNRPQARNAISAAMVAELSEAVAAVRADPGARVLVVTGAGSAFQSGADIRELSGLTQPGSMRWLENVNEVFLAIERLPIPVIAAVNGPAFGGGFELALSCDMRVAAASAVFALPETGLGIIPGAGGCERLSRIVGRGVASELVMTGRAVDAAEALRLGIVNRVAPHGKAVEAAMELAATLRARPPMALAMAKKALSGASGRHIDPLVFESARMCALCFASADAREGMEAFLEKRPARFGKAAPEDAGK